MSDNPDWGTPARGVMGRGPGDYSQKIMNNSQPIPATNYGIKPQDTAKYDTLNTPQRFSTPAYTSFVRKSLSRPGFVPTIEDF